MGVFLYMNYSGFQQVHITIITRDINDFRTEENTQKEHRDIAEECKSILKEQFPNVAEALWSKTL